MATIAELAADFRAGLLSAAGGNIEKAVDSDKAIGAMLGLMIQEAQRNGQDPAGYTIPEEMRDLAMDMLRRICDDAWNVWDQWQAQQQS